MLVSWTVLRPSKRARRWQLVGSGIAVASSAALFAAAVSAEFDVALASLAGLVGALALVSIQARTNKPLEVGVSLAGEVKIREYLQPTAAAPAATPESLPLRLVFAAPWLISFRCGTMFVPIWPDCLPRSIFRQLWVHLRWGRAVPNDNNRV